MDVRYYPLSMDPPSCRTEELEITLIYLSRSRKSKAENTKEKKGVHCIVFGV